MGDLINWMTFLCSVIVATIISLATFLVNIKSHKQDVITQSITVNRIEWISDVRNLFSEFLYAYIDKKSKDDLVKLMGKIRLFFHNESAYYQDFFTCMKKCCEEPYSEERAEELEKEIEYEEKKLDICAYGTSDLMYIEGLKSELEELNSII